MNKWLPYCAAVLAACTMACDLDKSTCPDALPSPTPNQDRVQIMLTIITDADGRVVEPVSGPDGTVYALSSTQSYNLLVVYHNPMIDGRNISVSFEPSWQRVAPAPAVPETVAGVTANFAWPSAPAGTLPQSITIRISEFGKDMPVTFIAELRLNVLVS